MKISFNWLRKYLDFSQSPEEIGEILTNIGLEVEGLEKVETIKGGLRGVVVGRVKECVKHPNADKLSLTKVDLGLEEDAQIVCGAPNLAAGQKVLVATVGTTLYSAEGEPWKIKKGKIRGEVSEGMICAEDELGLGNDHSGIIVLPDDVEVGMAARDYYKIEDDYVYEIGLTPNRSDATSHLGVVRDLAAYLKINDEGNYLVKDFVKDDFGVDAPGLKIDVNLEDRDACLRYSGICLTDVEVKDSPEWLKNLLRSIGIRPISNVVDITNFILHAYGQPLHAFDADKIEGGEVRIKKLSSGTKFLSLDEKERSLHEDDLMICDGNDKPMCIAGVFGGIHSGVTEHTTNIFLESAHFEAVHIRKTSTRHLLRTEAAKVFEKGSDPNLTVKALKKAVSLLKKYASANVSSEIVDIYPRKIEPRAVLVRFDRVNSLIGAELSREEIADILNAMGMASKPVEESKLYVYVPTDKADVTREVDVIEEILRIYGFNKVELPSKMSTAIHSRELPNPRSIKKTISELLSANGFNEMMGLSLAESCWYGGERNEFVFINNTSNIHLDIMRPDALRSGLDSVRRNLNHQQSDIHLYEFGKAYTQDEEFQEKAFLSMFLSGLEKPVNWKETNETDVDFYSVKKWVLLILERLNISSYQVSETENKDFSYGLKIHRGTQDIVHFGKLDDELLKEFGIKQEVFFAEFDFDKLSDAAIKTKVTIDPINKYPATSRDLALVLDETVTFSEVENITKKTEKKLISDIELFDVYKNEEQLGADKKSYAVKFIFEDYEKTLKDKEVDKVMNKLIDAFGKNLGAQIRK